MKEDIYFRYSWQYRKEELRFCPKCGQAFSREDLHIPNQPQLICHSCSFIFYIDPKVAVSACIWNPDKTKILLLKRAENPQKGLWAFPGGYVERGHDVMQSIRSEIKEETDLDADLLRMIHMTTHTESGTIELIFEGVSSSENIQLNMESMEGSFFSLADIPFSSLAFDTTKNIVKKMSEKVSRESG